MIKIAHRGNIDGPVPDAENNPAYVQNAIKSGYQAEVDFWIIDNIIYFGHDAPQYEIDPYFIIKNITDLWLHCKNLNALDFVLSMPKAYKAFWHQEDDFTITTNGYIWTYPGKPTTNKSILVCKDVPDQNMLSLDIAGICSPYIGRV